jgi:hypothetical protein
MRLLLRDALKALLMLVLWVGIVEAALQLGDIQLDASMLMRDWHRQFHLRPNAHGYIHTDIPSFVRNNNQGFQDRDREIARSPGTLRIAFIGSSQVQSPQVRPDQAFTGILEQELNKIGGLQWRNVEVFNFGVGGYGLAQHWITLHEEIWQYHPQIVVEAVGLYNDIVNCDRYTSVTGNLYPYFTASGDQLIPDAYTRAQRPPDPRQTERENHVNDLKNRFKLALLTNNVIDHFHPKPRWQPGLEIDPNQTSTFFPPKDPHLQNAWNVAEISLRRMAEECRTHGAEFWIMPLDFHLQADPDPVSKARRLQNFGITDVHYPDRRLMQFAKGLNAHTFWLSPLLEDYATSHRTSLHFITSYGTFLHYNLLGHRVIADMILEELRRGSERLAGNETPEPPVPPATPVW